MSISEICSMTSDLVSNSPSIPVTVTLDWRSNSAQNRDTVRNRRNPCMDTARTPGEEVTEQKGQWEIAVGG